MKYSVETDKRYNLLPWLMIFFAGICLRTGISSLAPVLDLIQAELNISQSLLGILTAIPVLCMGVLSPLGSYFERRFGLKRSMLAAFLILITGFLLRLDSGTYTILLITAAFIGIADAIIRPLLSGFIKETFENKAGGAMSIYAASMGIGSAMAAYGTLPIASMSGYGWRGGLSFWAIPTVIGFVIWLLGYKSRDTEKESKKEKVSTKVSKAEILFFTLFFGIQAGMNYAIVAWLPSLLKDGGVNEYSANILMTVFILLQTVTSLFFAVIVKVLRMTHARVLLLFTVLTAVGVGSLFFLQHIPWLWVVTMGIATGGLFPIALLLPIDFSDNKSEATYLTGLTQSGGYLLGGLIPWVVGFAADKTGIFRGISIVLIAIFVLLCFVVVRIMRSYKLLHR